MASDAADECSEGDRAEERQVMVLLKVIGITKLLKIKVCDSRYTWVTPIWI